MPINSIIFNPVAGRANKVRARAALQQFVQTSSGNWQLQETRGTGHAQELAQQALRNGAGAVVAAGGDGTLNEVLRGVMLGSSTHTSQVVPLLGLLPLGTGNDFARTLGISLHLESGLKVLQQGHRATVDVGWITVNTEAHPFLNVCGTGFDALVASRVNADRYRWPWRLLKGPASYMAGVLRELAVLQSAQLRLTVDGSVWEGRALMCAIANARSYGGGMLIAPQASLSDGLLDICLIQESGRLEFLRALPGVFSGNHISHPRVQLLRGREVFIESDRPLPVLVDGEVLGSTPLQFRVQRHTLNFLVPADFQS